MIKSSLKRVGVKRKGLRKASKVPQKQRKLTKREKTKDKVWSLKRADIEFRKVMLESVLVKCIFTNCSITDPKKLTVSHYFGRVNKGTRFRIENCDFLCRNHHYWDKQLGYEFQKQTIEKHGWNGRYTLHMREKLGTEGFEDLKALAELGLKPKLAIQLFQATQTIL